MGKIHRGMRWIAAISILLGLALMFDIWDSLRGDYGWRWGYASPHLLKEWLPVVLALLIYGLGCLWLMRGTARPLWQVIVWGFLGSLLMPFIFLLRWGDPFYLQFTRTASGITSGPHLVAALYTPDTVNRWLRDWTGQQKWFAKDGITIHAALAPPGLPIVYYLTDRALEKVPAVADPIAGELRPMQCQNLALMRYSNAQLSSAVLGMASPLWAALAIFPLVILARRLVDDETLRWCVLLWALLPGVALFTPTPNTVFPTLAILCCALLWLGLEQRVFRYVFAAGVVASALTFLNFSILPLLLFCGLLTLGYQFFVVQRTEYMPALGRSLQIGVIFGIGLATFWIIWAMYGGPPLWAMLKTAMSQHLELERPYLPWLGLHLWDYGLFLGLPLMLLSLWAMWCGVRQFREKGSLSALHVLALSLGLTLILLDFSGTARGETGRVWQFLFPLSLLVGVAALRELPSLNHRLLLGIQSFSALILLLFLPVIGTGLGDPPQEPPKTDNPAISVDTNISVDGKFRLTGYGGAWLDGNHLAVDLRWQADQWSDQPYYFSIIPVAPDGSAYQDGLVYQPFNAAYPTTCWQPGQVIVERVVIPLEGAPPQGEWWLSLSAQKFADYAPVRLTLPDGSTDQQTGIGPMPLE